jgi:urate oxidase
VVKNIIASLVNGYGYSNKAKLVCQCLNKELSGYEFYSYTSADNTAVLVNDDTMSKVLDFFTKEEYQPYVTSEQVDRGKSILGVANDR